MSAQWVNDHDPVYLAGKNISIVFSRTKKVLLTAFALLSSLPIGYGLVVVMFKV